MKLKTVFESDYMDFDSFAMDVIEPIFGSGSFKTSDAQLDMLQGQSYAPSVTENIISCLYMGDIKAGTQNPLEVYDITLRDGVDIARSRVGIQQLVRSMLQNYAHAFMIFHYDNSKGKEWRFSYLFKEATQKDTTSAKRFTYLFGAAHHCRTASERFNMLAGKREKNGEISDADLLEAFSVEALTKEFYGKLFKWYEWATSEESGVTFQSDSGDGINVKMIRLITRLLFVWFIKQKKLVPDNIFDEEYLRGILKNFDPLATDSGCYYNAILQNLFFATLNRAIVDDEGNPRRFASLKDKRDLRSLYRYSKMFSIPESKAMEIFAKVPFLNGGLFECLDKFKKNDIMQESDRYLDGFTRNAVKTKGRYKYRAFIPNRLFFNSDEQQPGIINLLKQYNFTVEENTPLDVQISLDPELLGKVFENLLAFYNPETRETARKATGSFYTPREIVDYMVCESLTAYLKGAAARAKRPLEEQYIRSLFSGEELPNSLKNDPKTRRFIAEALQNIKILDLACGSGAFPMGCLNRIVDALEHISVPQSRYELKLRIIENCVYGVDIQPIAMLICKLRFFISMICEQTEINFEDKEHNFGVNPLPNLETKFVAANSLINIKKKSRQSGLFEDPDINKTKLMLMALRHEHFYARSTYKKQKLRDEDECLRQKLADLLEANGEFAPEDARLFAGWNPYDQNAVSPFFDPEWMFGVKDGFDIVIGNPPYIQLQNNGGELGEKYEPHNFETFVRTGDIYSLFYEKGGQLLKQGGHLCFITSNKWMRAGYGEKTRKFLFEKTNPLQLIDFAGVKIFESATVDTNILLFEKAANKNNTLCCVTKNMTKRGLTNLSLFVQQHAFACPFTTSDSWVILSPIEQSIKRKIEAVGTPLKDWDINIYRGVLTGCNEAFIISTEKRDEILANCQTKEERKRTEEIIRPILRGRDIKRYSYDWAGLWL
ncbi:Eco57I restriction-modification methylase domain-containing protein, partial [Synergistes jonesii]